MTTLLTAEAVWEIRVIVVLVILVMLFCIVLAKELDRKPDK
jgi:hypothetical protein